MNSFFVTGAAAGIRRVRLRYLAWLTVLLHAGMRPRRELAEQLARTGSSLNDVRVFFVTCCRVCVAKADSAFSSPPLFLGTDVKVILLHDIGSVLAQHPRTFRHVMVVTYMCGDSGFVCGVESSAWRMFCERGDELVGPTQRCLVLLLQSFRPRRPIPCLSKCDGCSSCSFLVFELFIVSIGRRCILCVCSTRGGRGRKAVKPAAKQTASSKARASKKRAR